MGLWEAVAEILKTPVERITARIEKRTTVDVRVWNRGRGGVEKIRDTARHVAQSISAGNSPRETLESMPPADVLRGWADELDELANRLPTDMQIRVRLEALRVLMVSLPMTLVQSAAMSELATEGKVGDRTIEALRVWWAFAPDTPGYSGADWIDFSAVEPDSPSLSRQPSPPEEQREIRGKLRRSDYEHARAVEKMATHFLSDMDKMRRNRLSVTVTESRFGGVRSGTLRSR